MILDVRFFEDHLRPLLHQIKEAWPEIRGSVLAEHSHDRQIAAVAGKTLINGFSVLLALLQAAEELLSR